ncbi:EcsC family protein [Acetobacterium bakii]|uniref:EcsC protein family n=1 Tax=Acetobacterium bakii TaxID=52689 RepID=A0A0L6TYB3_9FIRM|nr:EcsC family protein [Acetobacterium bakii]KNZ41251.1 EcsC protein family [Acetobacterium bakii]
MKKDQILLKQLTIVEKHEQKFLNQKENSYIKLKFTPVINKIQTSIPAKLSSTLDVAFYKGFQLVFEKGNAFVEKTYNKDKIDSEYDLNNYAIDKYINKKYLKNIDKQSKQSKLINESISALEGGVLGLLGIGLPDIPLFIGVIIRTINEIALSYGYQYQTDCEKAYILYLICGAMAKEDARKEYNEKLDLLANNIDTNAGTSVHLETVMKETSDLLSATLLTAKFVQGLPIVGVIGGVVNPLIINKIGKYARIKYRKRYLHSKVNACE